MSEINKIQSSERELATIRRIAEVRPIEGADAIEAVRVDGWWVVAKKGEYTVDSLAVYLEIDSWVPTALAPFLTKPGHEPKEFEGVKGERLRTIKLRGQVSQGLLLPIANFSHEIEINGWCYVFNDVMWEEGEDVTAHLGILKYEKPLAACLAGMAKGNFPAFIPKTDQPRIQNCGRQFEDWKQGTVWEVTEKLDGSSMTVYFRQHECPDGEMSGVCSRNLDLKFDEANSFWEAAVKYDLINKIMSTGRSLAIQGELIGEGIQGNSYKLIGRQLFCFDIWDIDNQKYLLPAERFQLCKDLDIPHVPVLGLGGIAEVIGTTQAMILKQAEGKSAIGVGPEREGIVWKSTDKHDVSFKAISDKWLLKNGE
jgi:RNA ligase (TIGR02306 family)